MMRFKHLFYTNSIKSNQTYFMGAIKKNDIVTIKVKNNWIIWKKNSTIIHKLMFTPIIKSQKLYFFIYYSGIQTVTLKIQ